MLFTILNADYVCKHYEEIITFYFTRYTILRKQLEFLSDLVVDYNL